MLHFRRCILFLRQNFLTLSSNLRFYVKYIIFIRTLMHLISSNTKMHDKVNQVMVDLVKFVVSIYLSSLNSIHIKHRLDFKIRSTFLPMLRRKKQHPNYKFYTHYRLDLTVLFVLWSLHSPLQLRNERGGSLDLRYSTSYERAGITGQSLTFWKSF